MRTILLLGGFLLLTVLSNPKPAVAEEEGTIVTFWPLIDYRSSEAVDYRSLSLLGPLIHYDRKGSEREYGLRPLFFQANDSEDGSSMGEYLYPVASSRTDPEQRHFQFFHLLDADSGPDPASDNQATLFPLIFSDQRGDHEGSFAFFPFGGTLYNHFGRDEIHFALFPLYGRTVRRGTTVTNVLWPVFAHVEGDNEKGFKFWPLFGASRKEGVYRKNFYLWPIFWSYDLKLDTESPVRRRAVFPLYISSRSAEQNSTTYLWPLFSHREDHRKGYEEWNFPWPLFRVTRGEYKDGNRYLPFYADERTGSYRKRWYLWPLYKIEHLKTEQIDRRRDRVLFFLYSDTRERYLQENRPDKRQISFWPLFTYRRSGGVSHFFTLSLLEPFYGENQGVEHSWAPLWRLYQVKRDRYGNEMSSFLWNLYWKERRGDDLAWELFPLFSYRSTTEKGTDFRFLKGLLRLKWGQEGTRLHLFYLPWGIPLGGGGNAVEES